MSLGKIEVLNPRKQWKNEERDFTPWLAENIEYLSEVIGVDIEIEEIEKRVGRYELDIYGRIEGTEDIVVIENQLESSDHKHLGQLLTYASGLDAAVCVWVTPYINDEHKQAIEWLNTISEDKKSFFLVRPELIRIDDSKPAARFYLEAGPSSFGRTIRTIKEKNAPRHQFRREFWQGLLDYLITNKRIWAKNRRTTSDSWINFRANAKNIYVGVSMASKERLRVDIGFMGDTKEGNKANYYRYEAYKDIIISKFKDTDDVIFELLENRIMSRIGIYIPYDKEKANNDIKYAKELYKWFDETLEIAYEIVGEYK